MHAGWCWERLVPELQARGHTALAPDLPGHGERRDEEPSFDSYRKAIAALIEPGDVVVGHSLGGAVATGAADLVPDGIRRLIYLAAPVPAEGRSLIEVIPFAGEVGLFGYDESAFWPRDLAAATEIYYHDCEPDVARRAYERLAPQALAPMTTPISVPTFWSSSIPRSYIVCTADRSGILPSVEGFLERLGIAHAHPFRASHSPFLSRPSDLADLLVRLGSSV
jgi:pimeloyl-ACP methyl ester carboxylesterase